MTPLSSQFRGPNNVQVNSEAYHNNYTNIQTTSNIPSYTPNPCTLNQTYPSCYAPQNNQNVSVGRSWVNSSQTSFTQENANNHNADSGIPDLYQFSPLSGDLFQPEEIFQLDQPLNQNKVNRLHSPPQTLLDLGNGTIQLKGTVVANELPGPPLSDSQYYAYDTMQHDALQNRSLPLNKGPGQDHGSVYHYAGAPECTGDKIVEGHYPNSGSGYCENNNIWKGSDENGNLLKNSRLQRKYPEDPPNYPTPSNPFNNNNSSNEYGHYRVQDAYNKFPMHCHESPRMATGYVQPTTHSSYFIQSSSYLPQEISAGHVTSDHQNAIFGVSPSSNKSH